MSDTSRFCCTILVVILVTSSTYGSFEASEGSASAAAAAAPTLIKSVWDLFGGSMGSVGNSLGSVGSNDFGSIRREGNYPDSQYARGNNGNYPNNNQNYNNNNNGNGNYPDSSRVGGQSEYWTRPPMNQGNSNQGRARNAPRVSTERSGQNRFPDPTRIYDSAERETSVFLRVAPVLSQSTRNTPYEIIESIFHGPWSWEYAAQHVYALHWDLEYRFDPYGDTVFTFGSRKESDGKLWGSLDKKAFTEMPAKYFFLGNITTSPKAATQAAYDNPLNGQVYDILTVNCQAWAVQHCKDMSDDLHQRMKNFPTLLESTKPPGGTPQNSGSRLSP
ncbi:hypothetical protein BV898_00184 [Hypsibius exemplaris]|uniref:Uncharacterized protein n=1 Tax=Hypsibius exemplaris TaxID=2072580 RepID=A0A1W0XF47_HYPEX|nr:hypothetical protein BV898_00184 [Hypsibius exemplaris]